MPEPSRRIHARFPCRIAVNVLTHHGGTSLGEGHFLDISVSGALLALRGVLQRGNVYHFHCDEHLRLDGRVVREHKPKAGAPGEFYYGVSFNATGKQEEKIKLALDRLRPQHVEKPFEERLKKYWEM